jgi:hypothetical protein
MEGKIAFILGFDADGIPPKAWKSNWWLYFITQVFNDNSVPQPKWQKTKCQNNQQTNRSGRY